MKRVICTLIAALIVCTMACGAVAEPEYVKAPLREVTISEMLAVQSSEELDRLLFPSGLKLPTKYLDFLSFADVGSGTIEVAKSTYEMLATKYPVDGGAYTFAEYLSAQMYISWKTIGYGELGHIFDEQAATIRECSDSLGLEIAKNNVDMRFIDIFDIQSLIQEYAGVLDMEHAPEEVVISELPAYEEITSVNERFGIPLSMGINYVKSCTSWRPLMGLDLQRFNKFMSSRGHYMDMLGLETHKFETKEIVVKVADPDSEVLTPISIPEMEKPSEGISQFQTGIDASYVPQKTIGFRDITVTVALFIVTVISITFAILDWQRKRRDPTRRWRY